MTPIIGSSWGPVRSPNDPYLTPFVAMVSLFPRRRFIWNGLPWPRHKRFSPIPRWTQQPADIMRVTERLHFSQMCGKLSVRRLFMATSFHPFFCSGSRGAPARREQMRRICVKCSVFDIYPTSEDDLFWMLSWGDGNLRSINVQHEIKGGNHKWDALRTEYRFGKKGTENITLAACFANPASTDVERKTDQTAAHRHAAPLLPAGSFIFHVYGKAKCLSVRWRESRFFANCSNVSAEKLNQKQYTSHSSC